MPVRNICFGTSTEFVCDVGGAAANAAGMDIKSMLWATAIAATKETAVKRRPDSTGKPPKVIQSLTFA